MAVGISYGYAQRIVRKYNQYGIAGIKVKPRKEEKHTGGKVALISDEQFQKLVQTLESKPSDGGIWTEVKVARWIEKETGTEKVWNQRGWDYLKKSRYSWQRPRRKHSKGDQIEQNLFKQNLPILVEQAEYVSVFRKFDALQGIINCYRANQNFDLEYGEVFVTTTMIWGNKDIVIASAGVKMTKQYMKGDYKFVELDAGHNLVQEQFEPVTQAILERLQGVSNTNTV